MRDFHGVSGRMAKSDDRHKKVDKWLQRAKAQVNPKRAMSIEVAGPFATPTEVAPSHVHTCELCGAQGELPVDLEAQGLVFQCSFLGRPCGQTARTALPPCTVMSAPSFGQALSTLGSSLLVGGFGNDTGTSFPPRGALGSQFSTFSSPQAPVATGGTFAFPVSATQGSLFGAPAVPQATHPADVELPSDDDL